MTTSPAITDVIRPLPAGSVRLRGCLGRGLDLSIANRLKKVRYAHLVDPFRRRDETDGRWRCEFWGKIVRSAILSWRDTLDEELRSLIEATVFDLLSTQTADGCISSYPYELQVNDWDLWGRKYVLIGLARYYLEVDADERVARALVGEVDYLMTQVGPGKKNIVDCGWHEGLAASSLLEPVVLVHRITGEARFLDYALWIAAQGGSQKHDIFDAARSGVKPEDIGNGKSYEMMSCFEGLAELYRSIGGEERLAAVRALYDAIVEREIFITGVGGLKDQWGEYWYDGKFKQTRSDAGGLGETCVTTTWIKLCAQLLRLTGDAAVADQIERTLYNGVLGAMKPDGSWWMHVNPTPLAGAASKTPAGDQLPGYGEDCCLAQGPTAMAMAGYLAVMQAADGPVVNLYEDSESFFLLPSGGTGRLGVSGGYPRNGKVLLRVGLAAPAEFSLRLRIPGWSAATAVSVNGEAAASTPGTYLELKRRWQDGDTIELTFDMGIRVVRAFDGSDRFAVLRGPLVLAQDSRLGEVDRPFDPVGGEVIGTPEDIYFGCRFADGTVLCDYASAGNRFSPDNTLCVWFRKAGKPD